MTVVAIDGPAGSGKSTVARAAARALGFRHLDTGALYRALAAYALQRGIDPDDGAGLESLARGARIELDTGSVEVEGVDVTGRIRAPEVTAAVSQVAAHPQVRAALLDVQRSALASGRVVVEGRDIGTRVAPEADLKIWLTASLVERARRRAAELGLDPEGPGAVDTMRALAERDDRDSSRPESPLVKAPDAIELDTTAMSVDEVVAEVVEFITAAAAGR